MKSQNNANGDANSPNFVAYLGPSDLLEVTEGQRVQRPSQESTSKLASINAGDILWCLIRNGKRLYLFGYARADENLGHWSWQTFRYEVIASSRIHSSQDGIEIKGALKSRLGIGTTKRIGKDIGADLEAVLVAALMEKKFPSSSAKANVSEVSLESTETSKLMRIENRFIPKLLDDPIYNRGTNTALVETEESAEDLDLLDSVGDENQRKLVSHLRRERSAGLRNKKIKSVISEKHELKCEVCDFNFEIAYGELGKGFAEVHHIKPLSTLGETKTKLSDLAVLCSNCHRMIHRTNPIENLETFRARIQAVHLEEA